MSTMVLTKSTSLPHESSQSRLPAGTFPNMVDTIPLRDHSKQVYLLPTSGWKHAPGYSQVSSQMFQGRIACPFWYGEVQRLLIGVVSY